MAGQHECATSASCQISLEHQCGLHVTTSPRIQASTKAPKHRHVAPEDSDKLAVELPHNERAPLILEAFQRHGPSETQTSRLRIESVNTVQDGKLRSISSIQRGLLSDDSLVLQAENADLVRARAHCHLKAAWCSNNVLQRQQLRRACLPTELPGTSAQLLAACNGPSWHAAISKSSLPLQDARRTA
jgi:hypothetical protein